MGNGQPLGRGNFFFNPQSATGSRQRSYPPSPLSSPRRVEEIFFQTAIGNRQSATYLSPLTFILSPQGRGIFFFNPQSATGNRQCSYKS